MVSLPKSLQHLLTSPSWRPSLTPLSPLGDTLDSNCDVGIEQLPRSKIWAQTLHPTFPKSQSNSGPMWPGGNIVHSSVQGAMHTQLQSVTEFPNGHRTTSLQSASHCQHVSYVVTGDPMSILYLSSFCRVLGLSFQLKESHGCL